MVKIFNKITTNDIISITLTHYLRVVTNYNSDNENYLLVTNFSTALGKIICETYCSLLYKESLKSISNSDENKGDITYSF